MTPSAAVVRLIVTVAAAENDVGDVAMTLPKSS
jgi:hypothetical protein